MKITASIQSGFEKHRVEIATQGQVSHLDIPIKAGGFGSAINGGEFLCLALATCYCNDIYREAAKRNIPIESLEVHVQSDFEKEGAGASRISYQVRIRSGASEEETRALAMHTDTVAEIQNTIRHLSAITLDKIEIG